MLARRRRSWPALRLGPRVAPRHTMRGLRCPGFRQGTGVEDALAVDHVETHRIFQRQLAIEQDYLPCSASRLAACI